ncbi:glycosyltransferase [Horticoccus luteus]|uniref:Glycosyltransferase n=1 Tax=Horticoccus luteus TaxID=2862869 RepID=A0A8F9XMV7_9BACT|nr:glycosyltransferase family 2 protein [Horticoccus luteus]QYM80484.1 glycosyltransferase [Horticoccus luteus]
MPALPKISLVTTNYNYGHFLDATLRSVLDQNYPNLEYIVIDGGSTDNSVEIIRRYADRLSFWTSEGDAGQAHALNKGLRRCTGDIVGFLNSDDLHRPDTLANVAGLFADPDVAWIGGSSETLDVEGRPTGVTALSPPSTAVQWVAGLRFPQPSSFWRRRLTEELGSFEEHLYYCFDQEYWARFAVAGHRPVFSTAPLSRERFHPGQKTANPAPRYMHERLFIAHKFLNRLDPVAAAALRRIIRGHERTLLRDLFYQTPPPSFSTFFRTLRHHPDLLRDRQTWGLLKQRLFTRQDS